MTDQLHKLKVPNHLNFFEIRRAKVAPPWFEYISIPMHYNIEEAMTKWIDEHLKGRYFLGKSLEINSQNQMITCMKIGFEDAKEMSYFTLACPHLKY